MNQSTINDLLTKSTLNGKKTAERTRKNGFPRFIYTLFYVFAAYLVIPLIDVPLLGLSLSAPIFFFIAAYSILKPPHYWFNKYSQWIFLAIFLWIGIFISTWANGLISGGVKLQQNGILTVIRYIYWLIVFVITAYFASQGSILKRVSIVLGWSVLVLALLRWSEVLLFQNFGGLTGTKYLTQNTYGFLFSAFSPFLLILFFQSRLWKKIFALAGNLILWSAITINGSRGSWVAISIGLALCLIILTFTRPRRFMSILIILLLSSGFLVMVWSAFPLISRSVTTRYDTFRNLDNEKSYTIRKLMNRKGWYLFKDSPIFGVGASRFTLSSSELEIPYLMSYASQEYLDTKSSHNSYMGFLAEYGIIGAIPLGFLLTILAIGTFTSAIGFIRQEQYFALLVFMSFIQISIHMWVISSFTNTANWFVYGLTAATIMIYKNSKKDLCI